MAKYIGAHVSIAGSLAEAPRRARDIGADAMALFSKNQRQWKVPPLDPAETEAFQAALGEASLKPENVLTHDSYLINLAQTDPGKRRRALDAFIQELERVKVLGLDRLNFHPGSHVNRIDPAGALELIAEAMREAAQAVEGVRLVVETTAGQGTALGADFREIRTLLDLCGMSDRTGVCIDTCHIFAAGYDLVTRDAWERTMADFGDAVGFENLWGMHLNDSLRECGSRVDRHASLGKGAVGPEAFRWIMEDDRFDDIPLILETPDPEIWADEIALLRRWAGQKEGIKR